METKEKWDLFLADVPKLAKALQASLNEMGAGQMKIGFGGMPSFPKLLDTEEFRARLVEAESGLGEEVHFSCVVAFKGDGSLDVNLILEVDGYEEDEDGFEDPRDDPFYDEGSDPFYDEEGLDEFDDEPIVEEEPYDFDDGPIVEEEPYDFDDEV